MENNTVNTNVAANEATENTQVAAQQGTENTQPATVEQPAEKKSKKGLLKKIAIGAGAAVGIGAAFVGGFILGDKKSSNSQGQTGAGSDQSSDSAQ